MVAKKTNWKAKLNKNLKESANSALTKTDETQNKVVLSAFDSSVLADNSKNQSFQNSQLETINAETLPTPDILEGLTVREKLNEFIERGVVFYPSADDSDIENAELLTDTEKAFLTQQKEEILYVLQRAWIHRESSDSEQSEYLQAIKSSDDLHATTKEFFIKYFGETFYQDDAISTNDGQFTVSATVAPTVENQRVTVARLILPIVQMDGGSLQSFNQKWSDFDRQNRNNIYLHSWNRAML